MIFCEIKKSLHNHRLLLILFQFDLILEGIEFVFVTGHNTDLMTELCHQM